MMYSITNEGPEPMTGLRTGVPMELELLVDKCLAKEADRRYQSTADMVVDLETLSEKLKSGKSTILRTGAPVEIENPGYRNWPGKELRPWCHHPLDRTTGRLSLFSSFCSPQVLLLRCGI